MRRLRSLVVAALVLTLVASAPASAEDTVVATLPRPSTIRTYADIQVLDNLLDETHYLVIRRNGVIENLPVAPSQEPFDPDIGPDANGRPQLVYSRCDPGCDLFSYSLSGGTERPVRGGNTTADEFAPTLWKGRIAFARARKGRARPVVYTRELAAPRSRPSKRLPAVPSRARGERTTGGFVAALELSGNRLAQIVNFEAQGQLAEVRLVDVSAGRSRRLARIGVGEGAQYLAGLGFASGYLGWARGGEGGGIYRYRLASGELARAPQPRIVNFQVFGFALFAADGAYMVDAQLDTDSGCGDDTRACQVIRSRPLHFRPARR